MNLMPFSLFRKLHLQGLQPTNLHVQLVDHSIKHLAGLLEHVQIQADKFVIAYNFIVMDIGENSQVLLILGRPFLATIRPVIDMQTAPYIFGYVGKGLIFVSLHLYHL